MGNREKTSYYTHLFLMSLPTVCTQPIFLYILYSHWFLSYKLGLLDILLTTKDIGNSTRSTLFVLSLSIILYPLIFTLFKTVDVLFPEKNYIFTNVYSYGSIVIYQRPQRLLTITLKQFEHTFPPPSPVFQGNLGTFGVK